MSLYKEWEDYIKGIETQEDYIQFQKEYFPKETECYRAIIETKDPVLKGSINDLSEKYNMTGREFIGFLDGANTSFREQLELEDLTLESEINVEFDFEKLLWNMHDAKAEWLYELEEWNNIFDEEKRKQIKKDYNRSKIVVREAKIGRNDPCPCGSGKKYKKCCGQ
ncbi:MAG: SEC-C metal-binding domain-containing protein [Tissierellia bacterium]|nr:SEC-C metal-binding domain-containing protein [Tissierellia bacterium]MDD4779900.1 SEC-C metal-binding domain-containing protein [Tissierellia bacterium]